MFASNVITTQQLHSILCVLIYLIIHPFGIQNVRCLASLFQALEQASHLRVQFRKPLAILVQFLCRPEEPVVVSSPRSFSGTTETRVSKLLYSQVRQRTSYLGRSVRLDSVWGATRSPLLLTPVAGLSARTMQPRIGFTKRIG